MKIDQLSTDFAISPQIRRDDLPKIKGSGFRSILINRPDGEDDHQPPAHEIRAAAARLGLQVSYVPYPVGQSPLEILPAFEEALAKLEGPILAYCRSGIRSKTLWALSQGGKQPADTMQIQT